MTSAVILPLAVAAVAAGASLEWSSGRRWLAAVVSASIAFALGAHAMGVEGIVLVAVALVAVACASVCVLAARPRLAPWITWSSWAVAAVIAGAGSLR